MKHNIDDILEKYWEGDTSIDEEKVLKSYFSGDSIKEEHVVFKDLFVFFEHQSTITYTEAQPSESKSEVTIRRLSSYKYLYAIAAVFVLGVASLTVMNKTINKVEPVKTSLVVEIEDPEEALRITKQALAMMSGKFRESSITVKENLTELDKVSIFK